MTVPLTITVAKVIEMALSKIGVIYNDTEAKNIEDAHYALNLLIGEWSADSDLNVNRMIPVIGYTSISDTVALPDEYIAALVPNLAIALADDYDQSPGKTLQESALRTLNAIKIFNVRRQGGRIPANGVLG